MSEFTINETPATTIETPVSGHDLSNVKRLRSGDGSWRFEKGALIVSDENGIDRVLIGYLEDKF